MAGDWKSLEARELEPCVGRRRRGRNVGNICSTALARPSRGATPQATVETTMIVVTSVVREVNYGVARHDGSP